MKIFSFFRRGVSPSGVESDEEFIVEEAAEVGEVVVDSDGGASAFLHVARWALYALILLFPIWFLPITVLPIEINKAFVALALTLVALIAWVGSGLQDGRLTIVRTSIVWMYGLFLAGWLVAALFSQNVLLSLLGSAEAPRTLLTLLIGGLLLFLIPSVFYKREDLVRAVMLLMVSSAAVLVFFVLRSVLNVPLMGARGFNPIGSWNGLGIFFGFLAAMAFPLLGIQRGTIAWRVVLVLFLAALIAALFINFFLVWIGIGVLALVFFALYFSSGKRQSLLFSVTFLLVIVSLLLALLRGPLAGIAARFGSVPEVSPSWHATWIVAKKALSDAPIVGPGPNTFGLMWEQFRPESVSQTAFWRARFQSGVGTAPTLLMEGGLLGAVLFLLFIAAVLGVGGRAIVRGVYQDTTSWEGVLALALFSGSSFLLFFWFVYSLNVALVLLSFIVLGLFIASAGLVGVGDVRELNLFASAQQGFVASLLMIAVVIAAVGGLYLGGVRYIADTLFANGIREFNKRGDQNASSDIMLSATKVYANQDSYWRSLAELERIRIQRVLNDRDLSQPKAQAELQSALSAGIEYGKKATALNGIDAENWRALARVYEVAASFVDGAADTVIQNYERAREVSPRDPLIIAELARAHIASANVFSRKGDNKASNKELDAAIALFEEALAVKRDYAPAHFQLAQLYSLRGQQQQAFKRARAAFQLAPQDVGAAFQLGVIAYRQNDMATAQRAFERAVSLNANYSNARYFLGLIYNKNGDKQAAIKQFKQIAALNSGNKEVTRILDNLQSGRPILEGITPPKAAPEERPAPPIPDSAPISPLNAE